MERVGTIVLVQLPMVDFQDQDGQTVRLLTTVPSGEVLRKLMILSGQGAVLVGQLCIEFADRIDLVTSKAIEDMSHIRSAVDAVVTVGDDCSLILFDEKHQRGCVMDSKLGEFMVKDDEDVGEGNAPCKICGSVYTCFC